MLVNKFILPEGKVYMCGHSLGPSLKTTSDVVGSTLQDFASMGLVVGIKTVGLIYHML